ncbi:MAG: peroxiredoxin family protein, partial [bacterium]
MKQPPSHPARTREVVVAAALLIAIAAVIGVALVRQSRRPITAPRSIAPDFEISMYQGQDEVGGEKLRLSQVLTKGKPVVLNFFAGLCPP